MRDVNPRFGFSKDNRVGQNFARVIFAFFAAYSYFHKVTRALVALKLKPVSRNFLIEAGAACRPIEPIHSVVILETQEFGCW